MQFLELQRPRDLDLDLESGHTAYSRASTSMYIPNFIEIGKAFIVDGLIAWTAPI